VREHYEGVIRIAICHWVDLHKNLVVVARAPDGAPSNGRYSQNVQVLSAAAHEIPMEWSTGAMSPSYYRTAARLIARQRVRSIQVDAGALLGRQHVLDQRRAMHDALLLVLEGVKLRDRSAGGSGHPQVASRSSIDWDGRHGLR